MSVRPARMWGGFAITVLLVIAAIVTAFIVGQSSKTTTNRGRTPGLINEDPEGRARDSGMKEAGSVVDAASQVGHVVLTARDIPTEQLSSIWVNESGREVLEVYESGLTVLTEEPEIGEDPVKYYEAVVAEASRPSVFITEISGVQALAVEPNTDKLGSNPGLIRFEVRGLSIVVSGKGMSAKYLSDVASQLREVDPATIT